MLHLLPTDIWGCLSGEWWYSKEYGNIRFTLLNIITLLTSYFLVSIVFYLFVMILRVEQVTHSIGASIIWRVDILSPGLHSSTIHMIDAPIECKTMETKKYSFSQQSPALRVPIAVRPNFDYLDSPESTTKQHNAGWKSYQTRRYY